MSHYFSLTLFDIFLNVYFCIWNGNCRRSRLEWVKKAKWLLNQMPRRLTGLYFALWHTLFSQLGFGLNSETRISLRHLFHLYFLPNYWSPLTTCLETLHRYHRSLKSFPSPPLYKPSCWVHHFRPYHHSFTLLLFVLCSSKDTKPSILSQDPRHYVFPSIYLFLALSLPLTFSLLLSSLPWLAVH